MTLKPIHYKQGTIWVDDLAEINPSDKVAYKDGTCFKNGNIYHEVLSVDKRDSGNHRLNLKSEGSLFTMSNDVRKIIAQQGCGIPDISYVEIMETANDVEVLCNIIDLLYQSIQDAPVDFLGTGSNSKLAQEEYDAWYQKWDTAIIVYRGILSSALTKKWSDEDLRKAFEAGQTKQRCESFNYNNGYDIDHPLRRKSADMTFEEVLQSLQPKIAGIEIETIMTSPYKPEQDIARNSGIKYEPVSYQKDGQTFFKVKQIYHEKKL